MQKVRAGASRATYATYEIPIERPSTGTATGSVVCGTCGHALQMLVRSAAETTARRWRWIGLAALCFAVAPVPWLVVTLTRASGVGASVVVVWASALPLLAGLFLLGAWRGEDGVQLVGMSGPPEPASRPSKFGPHSLRR
jgi:hypothetical protein